MSIPDNSVLSFWDFHDNNIMYDELKQRWEVVDGFASEREEPLSEFDEEDYLMRLLKGLELRAHSATKKVFKKLFKSAHKKLSYNEQMDQKLLQKASLLKDDNSLDEVLEEWLY